MFCAASCFCRPGEARVLVTLGARGGEGMDTPPGCPVLPVGRFTWTQPLGMGGGGGRDAHLWAGGSGVLAVGCGVGWSSLQRGPTRKCHQTPKVFLLRPPFQG